MELECDPEHKLGRNAYTWASLPAPDEQTPVRKARHKQRAAAVSRRGRFVSSAALEVTVEAIENDMCWEDWNKVGMAVFAASEGSLHGFAVFDAFSARSPKYDPNSTLERWANYQRSPPCALSFGTLVYLSRQRRAA